MTGSAVVSAGEVTLAMLVEIGRAVEQLPLDELLDAVQHHETMAPILDPTAYQHGGRENLRDQRDLLEGAIALRHHVHRIKARREGPS